MWKYDLDNKDILLGFGFLERKTPTIATEDLKGNDIEVWCGNSVGGETNDSSSLPNLK